MSSSARRRPVALVVERLDDRIAPSTMPAIDGAAYVPANTGPRPAVISRDTVLSRAALLAPPPAVTVSPARTDVYGFLVHSVRSPYEAGTTQIRVLLPDQLEAGRTYPVVFLLPVEAGRQTYWGDGLFEARRLNLQNRCQAIFVAPTFSQLPWYADHPTRPDLRQETYFVDVVVPFIDANYPMAATPSGRLLVGFSKSGWGAFSLLLRHPDVFGKAAAWDAPLMMAGPNDYGMGPIFGTQTNFQHYQITRLLRAHAAAFQAGQRLVLMGYFAFRSQHQQLHALMTRLGISHIYRDGPSLRHNWSSGWLFHAVRFVLAE